MNGHTPHAPGDGLRATGTGSDAADTMVGAIADNIVDSTGTTATDAVPPALEARHPQLHGWQQMDDAQRIKALSGVLTGLQHALDEGTARR